MEYDLITALGNSVDNVYNNCSESGSRKTVTTLSGENLMHIEYRTIVNAVRESDLDLQMKELKKESHSMISQRLKTIKADFKKSAKRDLETKKVNEEERVETLTVSAYSPLRTFKVCCKFTYEVK
jgi:rRNA pseudouridine-1189 N-methylase Emg1 (Nep1/Mra1 family)